MSFWAVAGALADTGLKVWSDSRNRDVTKDINRQNIAYQKEFAQSGIQWRVADAKKAGLHPLAALGANTTSYSPSLQTPGYSGEYGLSDVGSKMGQAVNKLKLKGYDKQMRDLALREAQAKVKGTEIEVNMLESEYNKLRTNDIDSPNGITLPPKKQNGDVHVISPTRIASPSVKQAAQETGSHPSVKFQRFKNSLVPVMSDSFKQATEDSFIQELPWYIENIAKPSYKGSKHAIKPSKKEWKRNWPNADGIYFKNNAWHPYYGVGVYGRKKSWSEKLKDYQNKFNYKTSKGSSGSW